MADIVELRKLLEIYEGMSPGHWESDDYGAVLLALPALLDEIESLRSSNAKMEEALRKIATEYDESAARWMRAVANGALSSTGTGKG